MSWIDEKWRMVREGQAYLGAHPDEQTVRMEGEGVEDMIVFRSGYWVWASSKPGEQHCRGCGVSRDSYREWWAGLCRLCALRVPEYWAYDEDGLRDRRNRFEREQREREARRPSRFTMDDMGPCGVCGAPRSGDHLRCIDDYRSEMIARGERV